MKYIINTTQHTHYKYNIHYKYNTTYIHIINITYIIKIQHNIHIIKSSTKGVTMLKMRFNRVDETIEKHSLLKHEAYLLHDVGSNVCILISLTWIDPLLNRQS